MTIDEYFASVERTLRRHHYADADVRPLHVLTSDDYNGLLRCRVAISGDAYVDIYEVVSTELGYPVRVHYSYTFVHSDVLVFRYDNGPHHRQVSTFPHHKHVGQSERVMPSDQPTMAQVLREARSSL